MVESFYQKAEVVFGDVTLSKNQVRSIHGTEQSPGAGGWPTVRHFNKATGYGGAPYAKKTSKGMCDELGPGEEYLQGYVEEFSGASLCDIKDASKGCSEQQSKFIDKWSERPSGDVLLQLGRLQGMVEKDGSSMKADALKWIKQRISIFKQLSAKSEEL